MGRHGGGRIGGGGGGHRTTFRSHHRSHFRSHHRSGGGDCDCTCCLEDIRLLHRPRRNFLCISARDPISGEKEGGRGGRRGDAVDKCMACGSHCLLPLLLVLTAALVLTLIPLLHHPAYEDGQTDMLKGESFGVVIPSAKSSYRADHGIDVVAKGSNPLRYCISGPISDYPSNVTEFRDCTEEVRARYYQNEYQYIQWYLMPGSRLDFSFTHSHISVMADGGQFALIVTEKDLLNWLNGRPLNDYRHLIASIEFTESVHHFVQSITIDASSGVPQKGEFVFAVWAGARSGAYIDGDISVHHAVPKGSEPTTCYTGDATLPYKPGLYVVTVEPEESFSTCPTSGFYSILFKVPYKSSYIWGLSVALPLSILLLCGGGYFLLRCYLYPKVQTEGELAALFSEGQRQQSQLLPQPSAPVERQAVAVRSEDRQPLISMGAGDYESERWGEQQQQQQRQDVYQPPPYQPPVVPSAPEPGQLSLFIISQPVPSAPLEEGYSVQPPGGPPIRAIAAVAPSIVDAAVDEPGREQAHTEWVVVWPGGVNIRTVPSLSGAVVGNLMEGERITALDRQGDWILHERGWSLIRSGNTAVLQPCYPLLTHVPTS